MKLLTQFYFYTLLILFLFNSKVQCAYGIRPVQPPCQQNQILILVRLNNNNQPVEACIAYQGFVYGCLQYAENGECSLCPSATSLVWGYKVNIQGCVPYNQQVVNCEGYWTTQNGGYACQACPSFAPIPVPLSQSPFGITYACAQQWIPGCIRAKQYLTIGKQTIIGCAECESGSAAFSNNGGRFYFQGSWNNGIGCPVDGTITTCATVKLVSGEYVCDGAVGCPNGKVPVKFNDGAIKTGCLDTTAPGYDSLCESYAFWNSNTKQIVCATCVSGYTLVYLTAASYPKCAQSNVAQTQYKGASLTRQQQKEQECDEQTSEIKYIKNLKGECLRLSKQCNQWNQEGNCLACNDNLYPHNDGLCYKLNKQF